MFRLSIITINLNNATGLRKTIESVVSQSFTDYEYIIIDGNSNDGSVEIIKEFANNISYWISEVDKGIYDAMNKAILKAKGEYLQFLNSGDWFPDEYVLQNVFSTNPNEDIIYGDANSCDENGNLKFYYVGKEDEITLAYFLKKVLKHQATFYRKDLFLIDHYDEDLRIVSDWKFNIEKIIFNNCSIKKIDIVIINYEKSGISNQSKYSKMHQDEREKVINQLVPQRIVKDYEKLILFSDSPLLRHMPYLNRHMSLQLFISTFVGLMIIAFKPIRFIFKIFDKR